MSALEGLDPDAFPSSFGQEDLNSVLLAMTNAGGSDLFLMGGAPLWMKLHSKLIPVSRRSIKDSEARQLLISIYGDDSAFSMLGNRKPIDAEYEFRARSERDGVSAERRLRFRVNAVRYQKNGKNNISISIRSIPTIPPTAEELGVEADLLDACSSMDQGLILVVGATGNGKSTLLASIIRTQAEQEEANRRIITIESPIEFVYDGLRFPSSMVIQCEVGRHINTFNDGVVNALRQAPTTILVGEARDYATITAAVDASTTGHVVFSTVHANSVAETFQRMVSVYPPEIQQQARFDLLSAVKVVVAQRLVPSVEGKRVALREYLVLTQSIKDQIMADPNIARGAFKAVMSHGRPMLLDAKTKLEGGKISEATYARIKKNYDYLGDAYGSN